MRELALVVGCVAVSPLYGYAAEGPPGGSLVADLRKLSSTDFRERIQGSKALIARREWLIRELARLAEADYQPGAWDSSKELAMDLLGEYRAVEAEALRVLLDNLDFRPAAADVCDFNRGEYGHPSVRALEQMGLPLEPVLEDALKWTKDEGSRDLLRFVLRNIREKRKQWVLDRQPETGIIGPNVLGDPVLPTLPDKPSWSAPPAKQAPTIRPAAEAGTDPGTRPMWLYLALGFLGGIAAGAGGAWFLARRHSGDSGRVQG